MKILSSPRCIGKLRSHHHNSILSPQLSTQPCRITWKNNTEGKTTSNGLSKTPPLQFINPNSVVLMNCTSTMKFYLKCSLLEWIVHLLQANTRNFLHGPSFFSFQCIRLLRLFWELPTIMFGQYWTIYVHQETQRNLCPGGLLVWGCDVIKGSWDLTSNWKIRSTNSSKRAHLFWMQSSGLSLNDWVNHSYFWFHPHCFSSEMHVQAVRLSSDTEGAAGCSSASSSSRDSSGENSNWHGFLRCWITALVGLSGCSESFVY